MRRMAVWITVFAGLSIGSASADMAGADLQRAAAFGAAMRALDPHSKDSERPFQELVATYVPQAGGVQPYLDFLTASGFSCPAITSLAYEPGSDVLMFLCRFEPDLGATGEPNLSSVTEAAVFYVQARSDAKHRILSIEGAMHHGPIGP